MSTQAAAISIHYTCQHCSVNCTNKRQLTTASSSERTRSSSWMSATLAWSSSTVMLLCVKKKAKKTNVGDKSDALTIFSCSYIKMIEL